MNEPTEKEVFLALTDSIKFGMEKAVARDTSTKRSCKKVKENKDEKSEKDVGRAVHRNKRLDAKQRNPD